MSEFQVAYVPVGVPTFHLESAKIQFDASVKMIRNLTDNGVYPKDMLLSIDALKQFLDGIEPDLIILQNITFANSAYAGEVLKRFSCPVLLWTLREPVIDGGRLRLNSLTGAYSAGNALAVFRDGSFEYIFGGPTEEKVIQKVGAVIRAAKLKKVLRALHMTAIGHTPQGFGFGRALDADLLKYFGVTLDAVEARELIDKAKTYSDEECVAYLEEAKAAMSGLETMPENNVRDFARLYKAYKDYVTENHIGAIASRCWPDFFTAFGTPGVCGACHAQ